LDTDVMHSCIGEHGRLSHSASFNIIMFPRPSTILIFCMDASVDRGIHFNCISGNHLQLWRYVL